MCVCVCFSTHVEAVEGVVDCWEIDTEQANGDPGKIESQPPRTGSLRMAQKQVVTR